MFTESDIQSLKTGELVHGDDRCTPFTITHVRPAKPVPTHYEAYAISASGVLLIRITCNSTPGFHRANDHDRLPKLKPKPKLKHPAIKRRVKRARRTA